MQEITSERLVLTALTLDVAAFMLTLVNSPGFVQFIGQRNVNTYADAIPYIQKLMDNENVNYWVVNRKDIQVPVGVVTLIKRDHLPHHDIGFAFLPAYEKQGFAFEAATAVLEAIKIAGAHTEILATTLPENTNSIKLLEKLGLRYLREINVDGKALQLYGMVFG